MPKKPAEMAPPPSPVRDPEFAKRLINSVESHGLAPSGHGRQKWVRDQFIERFKLTLSPEAVRKWFAGEARPRPVTMSQLATVLEVDEAWLALGITPDETPIEKQKRNATAEGAVNYLAGMIQMSGGNIAYPDNQNEAPDLYAIIGGKQYQIEVKHARPVDGHFVVRVPAKFEKLVLITVVDTKLPTQFDLVRLPTDVVSSHGKRKGGYVEVQVAQQGSSYRVADVVVPKIVSFQNLDGELPRVRKVG